ncbi:MAG: apolipoprotein N-acyltransferase [bacterium]|nr:apolipoprotein N-acyltransferase [bacterium]
MKAEGVTELLRNQRRPLVEVGVALALSAAMLTLAFPKAAWWPLAFVALAPVVYVLLDKRMGWNWRRAWMLGYVSGCGWFLATLWWIGYVTVVGMLVLVQVLALFMGASVALGWWLTRRGIWACVAFTMAWLVYEAIQTYFLTGFPWLLLGYALRPALPLIQVADIVGVYGISALVVVVNVAVAEGARAYVGKLGWRGCRGSVLVAMSMLAMFLAYGLWRMKTLEESPQRSIRVALIQANIPSLVKHDTTRDYDILQQHVELSRATMGENPDVVIWPETAVPGYFFERRLSYHVVTRFVKEVERPLITGLSRYVIGEDGELEYYNSAVIIEPSGFVSSMYDKRHLVMFGEYVPFERYLPFLKLVTPIEGSFTPGRDARGLVYSGPEGKRVAFKVLICFEDVMADLARVTAEAPADILLNLTNDGWFRSSPGPYQHAALSAFRAIEQRRPLVRATNTGVTMIVDRLGRTRAVLVVDGRKTEIAGTLVADVPLHNGRRTLYAESGNMLLWLACGGTLLAVVVLGVQGQLRGRGRV